jgi:hypothetical protein
MNSITLSKTFIYCSILFLASVIFFQIELFNVSIILSIISLTIEYKRSENAFSKREAWIAHPLRLSVPLMIVMQSLMWLINILVSNNITIFNYEWTIFYWYDAEYIPKSFASFILLSSIFLFFVSKSYKPQIRIPSINIEFNKHIIIYIILIVLTLLSTVEYFLIYTKFVKLEIPTIFNYIFKILAKLRPIFTLIIINQLWNKDLKGKILTITFLSLYLIIGFYCVFFTGMRQLIFEPLILIIICVISQKKKIEMSKRTLMQLSILAGLMFFIFSIATKLKFSNDDSFDSNNPIHQILHNIQSFSFRGTAYVSDLIAYTNPSSKELFNTKESIIYAEILYGIPFGSLFVPDKMIPKYPFDMEFYWSYSMGGLSSTYVSGTTSLLFIWGIFLTVIFLILIGSIHGKIFQFITNQIGAENSWIIIQSILSLFFLFGLTRMDFLGFPAYSMVALVTILIIFRSHKKSITI